MNQQTFNRLPGSTMQGAHYGSYQQASHQQQFAPSTAGSFASSSTQLTCHPQLVHQNATFQRNTMSWKQVTNSIWVPPVSTNTQMHGSSESHQPLNRHDRMPTTQQPEFSLQQTSPATQSNQTAQIIYINQGQMKVGNYASHSSDNQSPATDYRRQADQTNFIVNRGPVSSRFDFQSSPFPQRRGKSVVSQINDSMIKSPTTTQQQPPQNHLHHVVSQNQLTKTKNPALFLHKENVHCQAVFFGVLKESPTRQELQQCNTIPTSSHQSMVCRYDAAASQANTHPQVVQSNNTINGMPRISQDTTFQQSNMVPTNSHHSMRCLHDAVANQANTHPQVVQSNNTISGMRRISQDTTLGTPTHKTPPPGYTESNLDSQNIYLKTRFINQGQFQNPGTSNNLMYSVKSRDNSQFVAQHILQGQRTAHSANMASCQQVRSSISNCSVSVNPSEELQRVSECQLPVRRNQVNLDSNLEAPYNQGCDLAYSRRLAMSQIHTDENNGQGKVQYCKDPAETFELVMALQKVTRQTQKAVAVVSPISQKASCSGQNTVNKSPVEHMPKINAVRTLPENVEKQSNSIMQPEEINLHQMHSSSIPATLENYRLEKECSHNTPSSDFQSTDVPQLPSSVCSSDLLQNGQNIDSSKNEKIIEMSKQKFSQTTHIIKVIKYLLHNQKIKHSQFKKNCDFLNDGQDTESSVKDFINVSNDVQKTDKQISKIASTPNLVSNVESSRDTQNIETSYDGQNINSLDNDQNAEGSNDGQTVECLLEGQNIESSHDGQNVEPLDNDQNNNYKSSNDAAFDLSKVQAANFTLEKLQDLVKSLEVTREEKEKETITNDKQHIFWDCSNTKLPEECTDTPKLLQHAYDVSVKDKHTVVFQHLETEQIKMLDFRHQILGNETFSPGHQEFKSSWLNVDGQPANVDGVLAEPISDYNLTGCIDNSHLVHDGTAYLDTLIKLGAFYAKADKEEAAQSGRSDEYISNDEFRDDLHEKSNTVDDSDCSHDSQPMAIELLSSDDAKLYFYENADCHLREKPLHLCQDKVLSRPASQPQPDRELSESELQSKFPSSNFSFSCAHVNSEGHGDDFFCAKCLEETPLLDVDLEESCLSPLEPDDQRHSSSPQLCKSDEGPNESTCHNSVSTINSDLVIPKYNESETTKTSNAQSQRLDVLSGDSAVEPFLASIKESGSNTKPMDGEIQASKGSTVIKVFSNEENTKKLDLVPPKIKIKKNQSPPKYPPYKKLSCSKSKRPRVEDDLFTPDIVVRKAKILSKCLSDNNATSFNNGKRDDRIDPIKMASPLPSHTGQCDIVANEQYKQKSDQLQVLKVRETIYHSNDRPHNSQERAIVTNSDTSQDKPHCLKKKLSKKVKFALYGSTANSGQIVAHHCHEGHKTTYAPVYITVSGSFNTTNTDRTYMPSAKQKVLSIWRSTFLKANSSAISYKKRKAGECVALKCKIKDLKKHVVDRNLPVNLKRKQDLDDSAVTKEHKKLKCTSSSKQNIFSTFTPKSMTYLKK